MGVLPAPANLSCSNSSIESAAGGCRRCWGISRLVALSSFQISCISFSADCLQPGMMQAKKIRLSIMLNLISLLIRLLEVGVIGCPKIHISIGFFLNHNYLAVGHLIHLHDIG